MVGTVNHVPVPSDVLHVASPAQHHGPRPHPGQLGPLAQGSQSLVHIHLCCRHPHIQVTKHVIFHNGRKFLIELTQIHLHLEKN